MTFAGRALARRLEWAEGANDSGCLPSTSGSAVERIGGGWAVFAGAGSPLTRAIGLGLSAPAGEAEVVQLESFFHSRGARVNVDLCPLADPSLLDALGRRGYRPVEFNNVLVRGLTGSEPYPEDFRVRLVAQIEEDTWSSTIGTAFFEREWLTEEELEVGRAVFRADNSECCFAVTCSGVPVGGGALAIREGLALLFADGTISAFRAKGFHSAMIRFRLNVAIARGCDLATASAAPGSGSQRNFERCGFEVAYTKVLLVEP